MTVFRYSNEELFQRLIATVYNEMGLGEVTVRAISQKLSLGTSQLNRRIKAVTGKTAGTFIMELRMEKARHYLLMTEKYTIGDVARLCGFADTSHFSHTFRRLEGISPTQFIERQMGPRNRLNKFIKNEFFCRTRKKGK